MGRSKTMSRLRRGCLQHLNNGGLFLVSRKCNHISPGTVLDIQGRPSFHQEFNYLNMSIPSCPMQRCPSIIILHVHFGLLFYEPLANFSLATCCGVKDGGKAHVKDGIHPDPIADTPLHRHPLPRLPANERALHG